MRQQQRISLVAIALLSLLGLLRLFFAQLPDGGTLSDWTFELLDDFLSAVTAWPSYGNINSNTTTDIFSPQRMSNSYKNSPFSHVYVISLPHRTDRRDKMEKLLQVLDLNWTYVDAVSANSPVVADIVQYALATREERFSNVSYPKEFSWPTHLLSDLPSYTHISTTVATFSPLPRGWPAKASTKEWPKNEETSASTPLTCATGNHTFGPPFHHSLPSYMVLSPPKIACWYSHVQVLQDILTQSGGSIFGRDASQKNKMFLILEDDVNLEQNFQAQVHEAVDILPSGWDMLFLGQRYTSVINIQRIFIVQMLRTLLVQRGTLAACE
jgi:GR25 family glycosyltransferase involved in LPS biosynthesis